MSNFFYRLYRCRARCRAASKFFLIALLFIGFFGFSITELRAGNTGNFLSDSYAWGEKIGFIRFDGTDATPDYGVTVSDSALIGYAWGEKIGYVHFSGSCSEAGGCPDGADTYGVINDGQGYLSGYAWSEKGGWIKFAADSSDYANTSATNYGVYIDSDGSLDGYAWGEKTGWIHFKNTSPYAYNATTTWMRAPTIGSPVVDSSTAITWHWTDNTGNEESYRVDYVTGTDTANDVDGLAANSTSWQDDDLSVNTQYAVHVHAYRADQGESTASSNSSAIYTLANLPSSLSLTADSDKQITASWSANSNPSGTEYYCENVTAGTNSGWTTNTSWISANLIPCTEYTFKVKARNHDNTETAYSGSQTVQTQCGGAGPMAPSFPAPTPSAPGLPVKENSVSINQGAVYTTSLKVSLDIYSQAAVQMAISNSEDFSGISWEDYQTTKSWFLEAGDGTKTVYVQFRSAQGAVSKVVSDSIILDTTAPEPPVVTYLGKEGVLTKVRVHTFVWTPEIDDDTPLIKGRAEPNTKIIIILDDFVTYQTKVDEHGNWSYQIDTPLRDGDHWIKLKVQDQAGWTSQEIKVSFTIVAEIMAVPEVVEVPPIEIVPEEVPEIPVIPEIPKPEEIIERPEVFRPEKIPPQILKRLPEEVRKISLLPELTFPEEISQAVVDEFVKPVISYFIQTPKIVAKKVAHSYALIKFKIKQQIVKIKPPDYQTLIDVLPVKKQISQPVEEVKKQIKQEVRTIAQEKVLFASTHGNINLALKEDKLTLVAGVQIKAFVQPKPEQPIQEIKGQLFFRSTLRGEAPPAEFFPFKLAHRSLGVGGIAEAALIPEAQAKEWLLGEYLFSDPNQDGLYEAILQIPPVAGHYSFKTIIDYQEIPAKEIEIEMLIDPEGYVYTSDPRGQIRLADAQVTLFWLNPVDYQWQRWLAYAYDQKNPQITDQTGQYSFLVPQGTYYLQVEKQGYQTYVSDWFEVTEGSPVNQNIELKPE